jgi:hypothetical protein
MKRFTLKLLPGASAKAVQTDEAHPDQSKTILDNAITVFRQLTDLGSATFNVLELQAAGQIGIQMVEICRVRPKIPVFDERDRLIDHHDRKRKQIGRNTLNS